MSSWESSGDTFSSWRLLRGGVLTANDADITYLETNQSGRCSTDGKLMLRWLLPKTVTACVEYNPSLSITVFKMSETQACGKSILESRCVSCSKICQLPLSEGRFLSIPVMRRISCQKCHQQCVLFRTFLLLMQTIRVWLVLFLLHRELGDYNNCPAVSNHR